MPTQPLLTDEVWAQLDPRAGRLSAAGRRALVVAVAIGLVVLVLAYLALVSGLVRPNLAMTGDNGASADIDRHTVTLTINVVNNGVAGVRIIGIAAPESGARVVRVDGLPAALSAGGTLTLTIRYSIDCTRPVQPLRLGFEVERPWGTATVTVAPREGEELFGGRSMPRYACSSAR